MAKNKTKLEKERLEIIGNMPCYACFIDGKEINAEVHHIRNKTGLGLRPSHFDTIPLCYSHHRTGKISVHLGKKEFVEKYGTEQEILKVVNEQVEKIIQEKYNII